MHYWLELIRSINNSYYGYFKIGSDLSFSTSINPESFTY